VATVYKIVTAVATEFLTMEEVKLHCRLSADTTEDELLSRLIIAAREYCENYTGRALSTQTIELLLNEFPAKDRIQLPKPPLIGVTSVKYKDNDGIETTLSSSEYIVDADSQIGEIVLAYGKSWPSFTPYPSNPIRIRYEAGYTALPESIKQAMLLLVGHWHENREAVLTGDRFKEPRVHC